MTFKDLISRVSTISHFNWNIESASVKVVLITTSEKKIYDVTDTYWDGKNFIVVANPLS